MRSPLYLACQIPLRVWTSKTDGQGWSHPSSLSPGPLINNLFTCQPVAKAALNPTRKLIPRIHNQHRTNYYIYICNLRTRLLTKEHSFFSIHSQAKPTLVDETANLHIEECTKEKKKAYEISHRIVHYRHSNKVPTSLPGYINRYSIY